MTALEWISGLLLLAGAAFAFSGGVGLFRLPDFFARTHAAGVTDTAGAGLILLGLLLRADGFPTAIRLVLIFVFLLVTSPTASHVLAQAALKDNLKPALAPERKRR